MPNGKVAEKVVDLMTKRPVWALVFMLLTFIISGGGVSYGISFLGQGSKITTEVAELKRKYVYLDSAIKSADRARIEEQVRLKEDGKLLSEASIRLIIKEELEDFEDRLIKRLSN